MDSITEDNIQKVADIIHNIKLRVQYLSYRDKDENGKAYSLREFQKAVRNFDNIVHSEWIKWIGKKIFVVIGKAGAGKSHLLGELVTERKSNNLPSILLLGQHFNNGSEPIDQICSHLDLKCKKSTFLEGLNSYGEAIGHKVLLVIDAINEGAGTDYWERYLSDIAVTLDSYHYVGLVFSIRTSSNIQWRKVIDELPECAIYDHKGFSGNQQQAVEYIFSSFGLSSPQWPIIGEEFSNPLFLIKYCYSHKKSKSPLEFEDFWTTIDNYCSFVNAELSAKYHYDGNVNIVFNSLYKVAELMVTNNTRWTLEYDEVLESIKQVAKNTQKPQDFLSYLIEEGMLATNTYNGKSVITFEFERFGDYFCIYYLIRSGKLQSWLNNMPFVGNYWEAISILVPKLLNKEAYEIVPKQFRNRSFEQILFYLPWREALTPEGIHDTELFVERNIGDAIVVCCRCLFKQDFPFNADMLTEKLLPMTLTERDKKWTITISDYSESKEHLINLADWAQNVSQEFLRSLNDDVIRLCAEGLIWSFCTTDKRLRDKSTHGLVNLLTNRTSVLISMLQKFSGINDPYIIERLYVSAYGIVMRNIPLTDVKNIACAVYNNIFNKSNVCEDIIVRDSAKMIIEFAITHGIDLKINKKVNPPFSKPIIPSIKTWKEIENLYRKDYDKATSEEEKNEFFAQNWLLFSMGVEHNHRNNMYGDFGRYTFQSSLSAFKDIDPEDMSNWAVDMIFNEYGYDVKLFGEFDCRHVGNRTDTDNIERIGKKYQWIALYKIMAVLSDKYSKIDVDFTWENPWLRARTIDPSVNPVYTKSHIEPSKYEVPQYNLKHIKDDADWLQAYKDTPCVNDYIQTTDSNDIDWINLFSYNMITAKPKVRLEHKEMVRDLWVFVQSFLVDKKDLKKVCRQIYKIGIEGRSFHENHSINNIYSREFYWSSVYKENVEDGGGFSHLPFNIGRYSSSDIILEPTYLQYSLENSDDMSTEDSFSMLMPNKILVDGLGLRFTYGDGRWIGNNGNIICFDNFITSRGHSALLIKKKVLLEYLNKTGKRIFWPILTERMLRPENGGMGPIHLQAGGYAYMDKEGKIHAKIRPYKETKYDKILKKVTSLGSKCKSRWNYILIKLHLRKPTDDIKFNIILKDAMTNKDFLEAMKKYSPDDDNKK